MKNKFKKSLTFCAVFAFMFAIFGAGLFLTACGHEHTFSEWEVVTEATCTEKGLQRRFCLECKEKEEQEIAAKGHTVVVEEGFAATCEEPGETDMKYCSVCNVVLQEHTYVEALGHNLTNWAPIEDENVSDCSGRHEMHCTNPGCDLKYEGECQYATQQTKPTCLEKGHHVHVCEVCNDVVEHDYADALGHLFGGEWKAAGKNESGQYIHTRRCLNFGCDELEVDVCEFGQGVVKEATCTEKETTTRTCTVCQQEETKVTAEARGHQWEEKWTYSTSVEGHHEHKCNRCQEVETEICTPNLTYQNVDCTHDGKTIATCTVCENVVETVTEEMLGHAWSEIYTHKSGTTEEDSFHVRQCTRCKIEDEQEKCTFTTEVQKATCLSGEVSTTHCEKCQFSYQTDGEAALGHDYGSWSYYGIHDGKPSHVQTCQRDGCGDQNFEECTYTLSVETEPDCTNTGLKSGNCSTEGCGHRFTEEIDALGHLWAESAEDQNEWTIDEAAQTHTHTCKRANCGISETSSHTYKETNLCDSCGYDGLEYEIRDGHAVVLKDNRVGTAKKIIIAEYFQGLPVEEIVSGFESKDGHSCGFFMNKVVQEIVLPKTLKYIRSYAFNNCLELTTVSVALKEDEKCSLVGIDKYAFLNCQKLSSAHLPEGLASIGQGAFQGCKTLSDIVIPKTVTSIGNHAFSKTEFIENNSHWTNDVLYINNHLIKARGTLGGHYDVLDGTICISAQAFDECLGLVSISLPAELVDIGSDAFKNCTALSAVTFKGSFKQWLSIDFENDYASPMSHASALTILGAKNDINIPETATAIPAGAFKGTDIKSVFIPKSVKRIDEEAFEGCSSLTSVTWDPECKLEYVGPNAFKDTPFFEEQMKSGALYVGHCLVQTNENIQVDSDGKYVVEDGAHSIASNAFEKNSKIKFVVLPESLQYIGKNAFSGSALERAEFKSPKGWYAFMLEGAGRSPSADVLGAGGDKDEIKDKNRRQAAELLTKQYQSYWTKTLRTE